jgi:transposase
MDKDVLEQLLARGHSLEEIGRRVGRHPSTVGYWVKKHGLSAAHAARHAARGGLSRERLEELVESGGTHRSVAAELGVSVATVRHWLKRYGLETRANALRRESREGQRQGRRRLQRTCRKHGETTFVLDREGTYRCLKCRQDAVAKRRRAVRAAIIQEAGGRCIICGYDSYLGALQFHHLDPSLKEFGLSSQGFTRSLQRLRDEAKKCVLLCATCHAEVEGGVRALSLEFRESLKAASPGADYPA